jgi:hypothetical protein
MVIAISASIVGALGLTIVAGFQVLLALAKPFGNAAWGGAHKVLPLRLRFASAASALLLSSAAWIVLARAGAVTSPLRMSTLRVATWICFGGQVASTTGNLASKSELERRIMAPAALVCAISFLVVAISSAVRAPGSLSAQTILRGRWAPHGKTRTGLSRAKTLRHFGVWYPWFSLSLFSGANCRNGSTLLG